MFDFHLIVRRQLDRLVRMGKPRSITVIFGILFLCAATVLPYHAVDNSLTEEDTQFIPMYLRGIDPLPQNPTYANELDFIVSVQRSVLRIAPRNESLPYGQKREPKELYKAGAGLCYDRSRVMEKILRYSNFKTRHIFLLPNESKRSSIISLITAPGSLTHAVTEVLTKKGWLVVDSNAPWVSIDSNGHPISIKTLQSSVEDSAAIHWSVQPPFKIYATPFTFVYGLYSRRGDFYLPYNFIPDIHYGELIQNVL